MKKLVLLLLVFLLVGCTSGEAVESDGSAMRIALYLDVIDKLMAEDDGLNHGIRYIGIDLSNASNLSDDEKDAIIRQIGERYQTETLIGTFEQLREQGYIDPDVLYWEDGILLTVSVISESDGTFTFDASKWRSGLGAIYFEDCTATLTADGWTFEIGAFAIA